MSTISATTLKTDATSKVLPGDKTGLPLEIWQIIFSYLSVRDLCHVACVSKTWHNLSLSMDMTRWKELYLGCTEWKHPFWPLNVHAEPLSWKLSYREQYLATRFWHQGLQQSPGPGCMNILKRKRERQTIEVGPGLEHQTLKSALTTASAYDKILIHPGIYDEQFETSVKCPVELVGAGELGSVILVVCIEQLSETGRLTNVVLRAPWFTSFVLKVRTGYIQVDNCIIEDGMMYVQNPATCHTQFCTFRHASIILQHLNASVIRNCEFSQSNNANIIIEGYMKEERSWAYQHLRQEISSTFSQRHSLSRRHHLKPTESTTSTTHSTVTGKSYVASIIRTFDALSQGQGGDALEEMYVLNREGTKQQRENSTFRRPSCQSEPLHCSKQSDTLKIDDNCSRSNIRRRSDCWKSEKEWEDGKWIEINDERNLFHCQGPLSNKRESTASDHRTRVVNGVKMHSGIITNEIPKSLILCQGVTSVYTHAAHGPEQFQVDHEASGSESAKSTQNQDGSFLSVAKSRTLDIYNASSIAASQQNADSHPSSFSHENLSREGQNACVDRCSDCGEEIEKNVGNHYQEDDDMDPSRQHKQHQHAHTYSIHCQGDAQECQVNGSAEPCDLHLQDHDHQHQLQETAAVHDNGEEHRSHQSYNSDSCSSNEDDLSLLDELESGRSSSARESINSNRSTSSSSSADESYRVFPPDHDLDLSDGEESVIMLPHLRHRHLEASLSANAVNADVGSICSQTTHRITLSALQDEGELMSVNKVQGCLVHQCRMIHSKGGVMVGLQAHAIISECDISNVGYGIRCIQNAQVVISRNHIHHCRTSGIFMRLGSTGLAAGNDIHSNNEAGIDIRKSADPIVQHNQIHHGKRSGVVVLGSGRGQIRNNDIYSNKEAGIYVLYGGNPTISENHIYDGFAAGIAINEGGRGLIYENTIEGNRWGGVDVRLGSNPTICRNTVVDGLGDGIVIGEHGQGVIENNIISGNTGCGVWIMSASKPYIHGNQISDNGDAGIMMVNKTDVHHEPSHLLLVPSSHTAQATSHCGSILGMLMEDTPAAPSKCCHTTVQYNNIYHNKGRGVSVELGDLVDILYNAIYANLEDGVWVNQEAPVTISGNSISNNLGCGIINALTTSMIIEGNGVYDNHESGLLCKGNADIHDNDVVGNYAGGISLESRALCMVCRNRIHSHCDFTVKVAATARESVITDNWIYDSGAGHILDLSKHATVRDNKVTYLPQEMKSAPCTGQNIKDGTFNKCHFLRDPPARPVIAAPPPPSTLPAHNVSVITKIMVPSGDDCQQGSKLCIVL